MSAGSIVRKEDKRDVRAVAAQVLTTAFDAKSPVGALLDKARVGLSLRDQGLLHELVLGTLRWLRFLDFVLETAAARPLSKIDGDLLPTLRLAVYQLLFLDRVPSHAAVHAAVEEVKRRSHRGATGFANAILRKVAGRRDRASWPVDSVDAIESLAIETSYPTFLARRWVARFGCEQATMMLAAGNRRARFQLTCLSDRYELASELATDGVETRPTELSPVGLDVDAGDPRETEAFRAGKIYIQDQASQAAALVPAPTPGERILDVAAAPGGKSFALLAAEPDVRLVAADASLPRLLRVRSNQERVQRRFHLVTAAGQSPSFRSNFDRVVVDLPCTGTGTFARHPELKWRISEGELERLAGQSLEMLVASANLVGAGGRLCAITCSLEREENEDIVMEFLDRKSEFELENLESWPELAPFVSGRGLWRVWPSESHDGFTVHVLRRR
ncbi:MAG: hypothetical protein GY769_16560 [bacterium]|nr:hypothetical protein [bacterium]